MNLLREYIRELLEINLGTGTGIEYTAFVLNANSHAKLAEYAPEGWKVYSHHMTIIRPHEQKRRLPSHWLDFEGCLNVYAIAQNDKVMTALVDLSGVPIPMKGPTVPHITIAVNTEAGGKPYMSNDIPISEFQELDSPVYVCGKVEEILR